MAILLKDWPEQEKADLTMAMGNQAKSLTYPIIGKAWINIPRRGGRKTTLVVEP